MMSKNDQLLKIAEMAKLAHINTRTLHYYDEIGLFSPLVKDENGYRFYALEQLNDLGLILSLKELSLSLKAIDHLLHQDATSAKQSLMAQKSAVDAKIEQFTTLQRLLTRKINDLDAASQKIGIPTVIQLNKEYLQLSTPITGSAADERVRAAYDLLATQTYIFSNNVYGTMVHSDKQGAADCDFFFVQSSHKQPDSFVKPAGHYLSIIYQGDDAGLTPFYADLKRIMYENDWQAEGYFFEKTIHETLLSKQENYLTEIQVKIKDVQ